MNSVKTLFDDHIPEGLPEPQHVLQPDSSDMTKEDASLDRLKNLEDKIAGAISKVKTFKEEKTLLEKRIHEIEAQLKAKDEEIERLTSEKAIVKSQLEELLSELDSLVID